MAKLGDALDRRRDRAKSPTPTAIRGEVVKTPADPSSALRVKRLGLSEQLYVEIAAERWSGSPTQGDQVLVVYDDFGAPWLAAIAS